MQRDLESVVRKVASFLEIGISEVDVKRLVEHLAFKNMKSNPSVNYDKDLKVSIFNFFIVYWEPFFGEENFYVQKFLHNFLFLY